MGTGRVSKAILVVSGHWEDADICSDVRMLLTYQQTIQGAFRDVSNALVGYRKTRGFRIEQEQLVAAAKDAAQLSEIRFRAGKTDYLEVLTNETNAFSAELNLAQANGNELLALVQLYQSLGGGWQE